MRKANIILFSCLSIQLVGWLAITFLSLGKLGVRGFAYEIANNDMPTWPFLWTQFGLGLLLIGTVVYLARHKIPSLFFVAILGASLLRLIAIFGEPIHESDFYRYIWDGKVAAQGINPYRFEPGSLYIWENNYTVEFPDNRVAGVIWRGREFSDQEDAWMKVLQAARDDNPQLLERVGHPAVTTIYPPVGQACFWFSNILFGDSVLGLKFLISLFDVGVVTFILLLLKHFQKSLAFGLLYAWNPLPIKELSNSAHYDAVAVFFIVFSIWVFVAFRRRFPAIMVGTICVALGMLAKYFVLLVLPVLLVWRYEQDNPKISRQAFPERFMSHLLYPWHYVAVGLLALVCYLAFLPYTLWNDAGWTEVFRGLSTYQKHWEYSPGLFSLVDRLLNFWMEDAEAFELSKKLCLGLLCGTVFFAGMISKKPIGQKCFLVMAALFVLSPTAFPWYYTWVLALVPFQKKWSWVVLSLVLPINYLDFHSLGDTPIASVVWDIKDIGLGKLDWRFYATQIISWGVFVIVWVIETIIGNIRRTSNE